MKTKHERYEHLFGTLQEQSGANGVFLAAENGEVIYEKAMGLADLATGRSLIADSVFDLASLSKPFTAAAVILLSEHGKLTLEDPVLKWLPELPYEGVTVRHLLQHTSGLSDYMDLFFMHWDRSKIADNEDVLALLAMHRPDVYFQPGASWQYSNTGYVLLAMIVAAASGMSFPAFMKEQIFRPLGMDRSLIYNRRYQPRQIGQYAYGYIYDLFARRYDLPDHSADTSFVVFLDGIQGDGAMSSTVRDLLKFDQALYTGKLISREAVLEAFQPAVLNDGEPCGYGMGWIIEQSERRGKVVSHTGGWPGYATVMNRYIDHRKTLIYLQNMEKDVEFDQAVIEAAEKILFDEVYEVPVCPPQRETVRLDPNIYQNYTGTYRLTGQDGLQAKIESEDGLLYLQMTGKVRIELYPAAETLFFVRLVPVEVEFEVDEDGKAVKLFILEDGNREEAVRVEEK